MTEPGRPPSASQLTLSQIMDQHHTCRAFGQAEIRRRHRLALRDALAEGVPA